MFVSRDTVITWPMDNQPPAARWAARLTGGPTHAREPGRPGRGRGRQLDGLRQRESLQDRTKRNYLEQLGRSMAWRLWDPGDERYPGPGRDAAGGRAATNFAEVIAQAEKIRELLRASSDKLICKELP